MITGTIKSQVDKVWDAFWSGGISNPFEGSAFGTRRSKEHQPYSNYDGSPWGAPRSACP
jgi:hypothetical protein